MTLKRKPSTPLSREAEAFIEMLSAERGASLNTIAAYGADLKDLEAFLARRKRKTINADAEALRAYLKSLDYVGMTPRTVARQEGLEVLEIGAVGRRRVQRCAALGRQHLDEGLGLARQRRGRLLLHGR